MEKFYSYGTVFKVIYIHDGIEENQLCILANTYESDSLFQVISLNGYHAGIIEGYVKHQYLDEKKHMCTLNHLLKELEERVFVGFKKAKIVNKKVLNSLDC